jgi:glycosyltransferase involved in cell wall biosynthesis
MNVLVISRYFSPFVGGNENQCLLLSSELAKQNCGIEIVTGRYNSKLKRKEIVGNLNVNRIRYVNISFEFKTRNKFTRLYNGIRFVLAEWSFMISLFVFLIFNGKKFDVLHIHKANWIALPCIIYTKVKHKPILVKEATFDGPSEMKLILLPKKAQGFLFKNVYFVAISSEIKDYLLSKEVSDNKIFFVPNGIELPVLKETIRNENELLFVGNFWSKTVKGLDILLKSFSNVIKSNPNVKLIILGDGNPELFCDYFDNNLLNTNLFFLGTKKDVSQWYKTSTIYISPSRSEGLSNSLIEAMAYGMPCIATNISGSNDLIVPNENGLLIEKENESQLSESIIRLLHDAGLQKKFAANARKTIEQKCQIKEVARDYLEIYSKILG